ncbi:MAG TPA: phosphoserine transaminase [Gammaproteobacteria bacterium]|jgi:phosphoserine aminotransferase|nr:phosphoserine transaminase [Pseudomonadota bacterium]HAJ30080.1 phosphoserine transaminase [Gammaproteobacteria bacterium]
MNPPEAKPNNPCFSSGPTAKRPGWALSKLSIDALGRSHRASVPKSRIKAVIDQSKALLGMPDDYLLGIVPGSDTGAFEMAMWTMLGARGVDVLSWESFGAGWKTDIQKQLKLNDVRIFDAPYGSLPDLTAVSTLDRDVVFTWNGTTSGACIPNGDWISDVREGLTFCDATSASFAMALPWTKLDVVTWSWQKVMGGEAAHGMIALSPRAVARLESYDPAWPLPKLFRLTKGGALIRDLFEGATINTPSMLAVEDQLDALAWATQIGGLSALIARSQANLSVVRNWVDQSSWAAFLTPDISQQSSTSICLKIIDPIFGGLPDSAQRAFIKSMTALLEQKNVAFDIAAYRDAPPGLRLWGGATVESTDLEKLTPWLDWAFSETLMTVS